METNKRKKPRNIESTESEITDFDVAETLRLGSSMGTEPTKSWKGEPAES